MTVKLVGYSILDIGYSILEKSCPILAQPDPNPNPNPNPILGHTCKNIISVLTWVAQTPIGRHRPRFLVLLCLTKDTVSLVKQQLIKPCSAQRMHDMF